MITLDLIEWAIEALECSIAMNIGNPDYPMAAVKRQLKDLKKLAKSLSKKINTNE